MQQSTALGLYLYLKRKVTLGLRRHQIVFSEINKLNLAETIVQIFFFVMYVQKRKLPTGSLKSTSALNFPFGLKIISTR